MGSTRRSACRYRERGSIFLLAMVILTVLLILGASLMERAQTAVDRASARNRQGRAFQLAEAGIEKALWDLNQPNGWLTYAGDPDLTLQGGALDITISPAPADRGVFTDTLTVIATGLLPSAQIGRTHSCAIRMVTHKDPRYFAYAIFGNSEVTVGNGTVRLMADSYDSDDGAYGGANTGASADIATNASGSNAVKILPQGEVNGNVSVGINASPPESAVSNQGAITGTITNLEVSNLLPSVTSVPAGAIELGDVWLEASEQLVLDPGVYHMTDCDIFGSAQIICNGKVVIYMDMSADTSTPDVRIGGNGIVNTSQIPANLTIYCAPDVTTFNVSGNAAIYAGIYAPQADIVMNSGNIYGSVVGDTVTLNGTNSHIHYDEALRDNTNPHAVMRSWEVL